MCGRLIFDTDMGNDVDDALALGVIHALQSRGVCELLAVTLTKRHPLASAYVQMLNRFYGRPDIPIGTLPKRIDPPPGPREPFFLTLAAEQPPPPAVHDAVTLLRQTLAAAADGSVTIVQVGFSTNLAALLDTQGDDISPLTGAELAARKVKRVSVMGGAFAAIEGDPGYREFNIVHDIPAAQALVERWPTPMVFSGFEVGLAVPYPAVSIENDFGYVTRGADEIVHEHPLVASYQVYQPTPHERPTWDLTSVLYAVLPERGYFGLSAPGRVTFSDEAASRFDASPNGRHRYLTLDGPQAVRVREALVQLVSQPPAQPRLHYRPQQSPPPPSPVLAAPMPRPDATRTQRLNDFVQWTGQHITGDEKGEAQTFLDHLFRACGQPGVLDIGATYEERIKKKSGGTAFADLVWKPHCLIEMKKRGTDLATAYQQAFDYWTRLIHNVAQ